MQVLLHVSLIAVLAACQPVGSGEDGGVTQDARPTPDATGATDAAGTVDDGSAPDGEPEAMRGATAAHNAVRRPLGLDDLTWSPALQASAQAWADVLAVRCDNDQNPHSTDRGNVGENIYWSIGLETTGSTITEAWASEVADYNYADNSCSGVCGHYTQIVWRSTTELGCGRGVCPDGGEWWVCHYAPAGNYIGEKPY